MSLRDAAAEAVGTGTSLVSVLPQIISAFATLVTAAVAGYLAVRPPRRNAPVDDSDDDEAREALLAFLLQEKREKEGRDGPGK